jgi:hypothetical protein
MCGGDAARPAPPPPPTPQRVTARESEKRASAVKAVLIRAAGKRGRPVAESRGTVRRLSEVMTRQAVKALGSQAVVPVSARAGRASRASRGKPLPGLLPTFGISLDQLMERGRMAVGNPSLMPAGSAANSAT